LSIHAEAITYCANRSPTAPIQARFSLGHGIARALAAGGPGPDAHDVAALGDAEVRRLGALVAITGSAAAAGENKRVARLIVTAPEAAETMVVGCVPGEPDMPLTVHDAEDKLIRFAAPAIGADRAAAMASALPQAPLSSSVKDILGG
jgi:2-methylcitrate dehydratase PrpD